MQLLFRFSRSLPEPRHQPQIFPTGCKEAREFIQRVSAGLVYFCFSPSSRTKYLHFSGKSLNYQATARKWYQYCKPTHTPLTTFNTILFQELSFENATQCIHNNCILKSIKTNKKVHLPSINIQFKFFSLGLTTWDKTHADP